jgi:DNA-binding NarL/FixJ family response regulator
MKVLLVDDHTLFRQGLKFLLSTLDKDLSVDEASDCASAIDGASGRQYDLILLDLKMPGTSGLAALSAMRTAFPETPVVVLSGEDDPNVVRATIDHGAMGFVPKTATQQILLGALQLILAGGVYLPVSIMSSYRLPEPLVGEPGGKMTGNGNGNAPNVVLDNLTPRQKEVLQCVIQGDPNKTIARKLALSESTVKAHLQVVLRALGARNRTEAVYAAAKLGRRLV